MKFAFSSNAFTNYSLTNSIIEISKLGYDGVEIMCDVPHAYPPTTDSKAVEEINNVIKQSNLLVSNINAFTLFGIQDTYHPSWIEQDESFRNKRIEHTINSIKLAKKLKAKNISIEPGGPIDNSQNKGGYMKLFADGLRKVLPVAEDQEIKILVEPEPSLLLETSSDFLNFIKDFDSPFLRLNFDIGHFYCVREEPSILVSKLSDYIEHFHIADIKNRVHQHLILGDGDIDFKSVFKAIHEIDYVGFITVELYPYKNNPIEAAKRSLDYIKKISSEL